MLFSTNRTIRIDKRLYEQLAAVAQQKGYATTEEMIRHVLEQSALANDEHLDAERAEQQLRGLGYLE
jgi:hypothetical protein